MKKILTILLCGVLVLGLVGCGSKEKTEEEKKKERTSTVITVTQQIVESKLKAPATADFPWGFDEYKIEEVESDRAAEGFTRYNVVGYVDSENSFGANIRSKYTVIFDLNDDDKFYEVNVDIK